MKKKEYDLKLIGELIIVPLCVMSLYHMVLSSHPKANLIVFSLVTFFTCIEFIAKYVKDVYVYEHKYNVLKIIFIIFNSLLLIETILNIMLKYKFIKIIFIIFEIILLLYLLYFAIRNILNLNKKEKFTKSAIAAFFSLLSFCIILIGIIIYLL